MNTITEHFVNRAMGYDKGQVDSYIQKLTEEYCKLQSQYEELNSRCEQLQEQPPVNTEKISKALVDAEARAIQIIVDAKSEAVQMIRSAHMELQRIQDEKANAVEQINGIMNKLGELTVEVA